MADRTVPHSVLVDRITMPVVDQTEKDVVDMAASSCCSDDDSSFCSMDASCSDDSSFSFDSVSDEDMSIASIANDDADDDADGLAKIELPQIIEALSSNRLDFTVLDLCVPIEKEEEVSDLLQAIRSNTTVTTCSIGSGFFDSLSERRRRELADSICSHSGLKSLSMDHSFPEFLYYFNCCRCWKRDQYYRQHQRYWEFQNQSIQEIRIRDMPADIAELPLGRIVMMTLCNFVTLERLEITWADEFTRDMAVLMRVALTGLSHSRALTKVKFGYFDEDGDYNFIKEIDATRKDGILRVLKLRCWSGVMTEMSYKELSLMLQVHKRSLKGLVLDTAVDNSGALTIANTVGRNNNLKALCLGTFDCRDETRRDGLLSLISQVLRTPNLSHDKSSSTSLEYLSLVCQELDDDGVHQIAKVLAQSRLRELMLFLDNANDTSISSRGVSAFANLLQASDTIEEMSVICNIIDDDGLVSIASVLERSNRTLKTLRLQCTKPPRVTSKGYHSVVQMLKRNTVVEVFELSRSEDSSQDDSLIEVDAPSEMLSSEDFRLEFQREIDFYLRLNQAGIRNLQLPDFAPSQFLGKLVTLQDDLDALFYMLSANPSFVACGVKDTSPQGRSQQLANYETVLVRFLG